MSNDTQFKTCYTCKIRKPASEFYHNGVIKDGLSSSCKPCSLIISKRRRENFPQKAKAEQKAWRLKKLEQDPDYGRKSYARNDARMRADPARLRAHRFYANVYRSKHFASMDLTLRFLIDLFRQSTHCKCCRKRLRMEPAEEKDRGKKFHDLPSVDRVDNTKGYTKDNVEIICLECNTRKRDLTLPDLEMLITYIKAHNQKGNDIV